MHITTGIYDKRIPRFNRNISDFSYGRIENNIIAEIIILASDISSSNLIDTCKPNIILFIRNIIGLQQIKSSVGIPMNHSERLII